MRIDVCRYACLCTACVPGALRPEEDVRFLGIRVVDSSELLCGCWDPLEEQPLLLTAEPSLLNSYAQLLFGEDGICLRSQIMKPVPFPPKTMLSPTPDFFSTKISLVFCLAESGGATENCTVFHNANQDCWLLDTTRASEHIIGSIPSSLIGSWWNL